MPDDPCCDHCGAEADMFVNGEYICDSCDDRLQLAADMAAARRISLEVAAETVRRASPRKESDGS